MRGELRYVAAVSHRPALGSRALFPALEAKAYLNHAAISPPSQPVQDAVKAALEDYARCGALAFGRWDEQRRQLKRELARLVGASPEDIALGTNTTRGLSDIGLCFPWQAGDRIVLFEGEFPANVTPWQCVADLYGLSVSFLAADSLRDGDGLLALEQQLRRGVRLVAVSAVQFQTGLRMPLEAMGDLCRQYGAALAVDAIQACGAVPVDVKRENIDFLSCGGHKWLMGSEGAGFVYLSPNWVPRLRPVTAGWLSHENPLTFLFDGAGQLRYDRQVRREASFFEGGTSNLLGFAALGASLPLLLELGIERIHAHVNAYLDRLENELVARGFVSLRAQEVELRSSMLCVRPPPGCDVIALLGRLREQGVIAAVPDGNLRFSPHFANSFDEIPEVLSAIDGFLNK